MNSVSLSGDGGDVNPKSARRYDSTARKAAAAQTRTAILEQARRLFIEGGYSATTVSSIAACADVAVDTVYAAVGKKPDLFRQLIEMALSGTNAEVPAREREYVRAISSAATAEEKIDLYAKAVTSIQGRLAPLFLVLREAAQADSALAQLWTTISERRAGNMRQLAAELRGTGQLRTDLSDDQVADIIWSMNAAEYYVLLVGERGWTPAQFQAYLSDAWQRILLT
jgi:AcrR family transcriptional regulator